MLHKAAKNRDEAIKYLIKPPTHIDKTHNKNRKKKKIKNSFTNTSTQKQIHTKHIKSGIMSKIDIKTHKKLRERQHSRGQKHQVYQSQFSEISNCSIKHHKLMQQQVLDGPQEYYFQNKSKIKQFQGSKIGKTSNSKSHNSSQSRALNSKGHYQFLKYPLKPKQKQRSKRTKSEKFIKNNNELRHPKSQPRLSDQNNISHKKTQTIARSKIQKSQGKSKLGLRSKLPSETLSEFEYMSQLPKKYEQILGNNLIGQKPTFDLVKIKNDIQQEQQFVKGNFIDNQLLKERAKSISMLGKISSSMNLRRQTYSQAIALLDRFLDNNVDKKAIKTSSIASLIMALKIQHSQIVGHLVYQFSTNQQTPSSMYRPKAANQKNKKNQMHFFSSSEQINEIFQNPQSLKTSFTYPKFNLNRPKLPNILTVVLSHEQIFSQYDRIICKQDISDMEMQMIVKFNFRLNIKSLHYWVILIFKIWRQFIYSKNKKKKKAQVLNLKFQQTYYLLLHFCQICQISNICLQCSKPVIVFSMIYILFRVNRQFSSIEKGIQFYRFNLSKTTNILFTDKKGVNQIYGEFLEMFGLDMGHIVNCCQISSQYLVHKIIKSILEDQGLKQATQNGIYRYHCDLYRYFPNKLFQ